MLGKPFPGTADSSEEASSPEKEEEGNWTNILSWAVQKQALGLNHKACWATIHQLSCCYNNDNEL